MSLWDGIKNIMNVSDDDYEDENEVDEAIGDSSACSCSETCLLNLIFINFFHYL